MSAAAKVEHASTTANDRNSSGETMEEHSSVTAKDGRGAAANDLVDADKDTDKLARDAVTRSCRSKSKERDDDTRNRNGEEARDASPQNGEGTQVSPAPAASSSRTEHEDVRRHPRVDVVLNPVSGTSDAAVAREALHAALSLGYASVRFHETTTERGAAVLTRDAVANGARVIVAAGGDGTVTDVVGAVRNAAFPLPSSEKGRDSPELRDSRKVCVGVVPRGTANALSSVLCIPAALEDAAALINRAEARLFDVAVVNGEKAMLLQCGIGLEAEVVLRADRGLKRLFGPIAYQIAGILPMYRQKHITVDVTLWGVRDTTLFAGGAHVESDVLHIRGMRAKAVTIANAAPPTSVLAHGIGELCCNDGLLEFVVVSSRGLGSLFGAMFDQFRSAILRRRTTRNDVFGLRARRFEVTCDPPQRVVVDGDDAGYTPVTVELDPDPSNRQIKIIAPSARVVNRRKRRLTRTLVRTWRNLRGVLIFCAVLQCIRSFRAGHSGGEDPEDMHVISSQ